MKPDSMDRKEKAGKLLFEAGFLIMVINLMVGVEIYRAIIHHWRVAVGGELFFQAYITSADSLVLTYLNQKSIYIYLLSVLFSFLGNKEEIVLIFNLICNLAGIGFFYFGVRKMGSYKYPFVTAALGAILCIGFYPVTADTSMHICWLFAGMLFFVCTRLCFDIPKPMLSWILCGVFIGFFSYMDFLGMAVGIVFLCFLFISGNLKSKAFLKKLLVYLLSSVISFVCTFCLWNQYRLNAGLLLRWGNEKCGYFDSSESLKQYFCLGIMLLSCVCFFGLSKKQRETKKTVSVSETEALVTPPQTKSAQQKAETMITDTAVSKKKPQSDKLQKNEKVSKEVSLKETSVEKEAVTPKVKFIKNPLPLPKKHVKKELNYAFDPSSDQMHYDLNNYRLDDDYDLKEL